jgi:hypothetical protein
MEEPWPDSDYYDDAPLWTPSGVVGPVVVGAVGSGGLALTLNGLNWTMALGRARVDGQRYRRSASPAAGSSTPNSNGSFSRRDRLVIRRDLAAKTCGPILLQGTPASSPALPALTQVTGGVYDLPLFNWLVPPSNGTTLTDVRDERRWLLPDGSARPLHGFEFYKTGTALPDGGLQNQGFATSDVLLDTDGFYRTGTNFAIVPTELGGCRFHVSVGMTLDGNTTGRMFADLQRSSGTGLRAGAYATDTAWSSRVMRLMAGEAIALKAFQDSGGSNGKVMALHVSAFLIGT